MDAREALAELKIASCTTCDRSHKCSECYIYQAKECVLAKLLLLERFLNCVKKSDSGYYIDECITEYNDNKDMYVLIQQWKIENGEIK